MHVMQNAADMTFPIWKPAYFPFEPLHHASVFEHGNIVLYKKIVNDAPDDVRLIVYSTVCLMLHVFFPKLFRCGLVPFLECAVVVLWVRKAAEL